MDYIDYRILLLAPGTRFTAFQLFGHDLHASIQLFKRLAYTNDYIWIGNYGNHHNYQKI